MNWINKNKLILLAVLLAAILRFYKLEALPALNADEAAIGYNIYSLIETGKDEHGNSWPIHFQSFNDYKPGGYFYIAMPFVYLFGLNEWSVRLPGTIFGTLTVFAVYLLAKEIRKELAIKDSLIENLAALLLAISPWHIHFSRGAWEVNVATFFIVLGVLYFIKSVKNSKLYVFSFLFFALSLYTYHAARVIVPILGIALVIIYRSGIFKKINLKLFFGSVLFSIIILLPLGLDLLDSETGSRASGVSIFADRGYIDRINERRGRYENPNSILAKLAYNKPKELFLEFSRNYFEHFRGEFLFVSGDDIQRNKVPEFGQLYLWQVFTLLIAVFGIARSRQNWSLVVAWLLIAPIPAALTFQSPHALRAQNMVIPLTIMSAFGLFLIMRFLKNNTKGVISIACYFVIGVIIIWDFTRYLHQYYVHMAKTYQYSSQYGVKELVEYLKGDNTREVLVTTRYDQPYILFLFYSKIDPRSFQNAHTLTERDSFGFSTVPKFGKFTFRAIDYEKDKLQYPGALIVGTDDEIPDEANIIKEIYGDNGLLYFQIVSN